MRITMPSSMPRRALALICCAGVVAGVVRSAGIVHAQRLDPLQTVHGLDAGTGLKAGWQRLVQDGCQFTVPESWRLDPDNATVFAPDRSNLSVRMLKITSWSLHKAQIRAAFGPVKALHEDSARRLWFEFGNEQRTQHYIDVVDGLSVCAGLLEVRATLPNAAETVVRIADSIGPATK